MTKEQVIKAYPNLDQKSILPLMIFPVVTNPDQDVKEIFITMGNDKLLGFRIVYKRKINWDSLEEFAKTFTTSISLNIPESAWKKDRLPNTNNSENITARCSDITLTLELQRDSYSLEIMDTHFFDEIMKEDENKKKQFKP